MIPTWSSPPTRSPSSVCALYFVLEGALSHLVHLGYGLAAVLAFIGAKLVLHWAHGVWPDVPEIPTLASLGVIVAILALVTATSLYATRGDRRGEDHPEHQAGHVAHPGAVPRSVRTKSEVDPPSERPLR